MVDQAFDFAFAADKVPVGKTLIYKKSNLDGTNLGMIAVHTKTTDVIESFKWHEGYHQATKVRAHINTTSLNVQRFEGLTLFADGTERTNAELTTLAEGVFKIRFGETKLDVDFGERVWHSYDFDFASLGYAFKFIKDKKAPIAFSIFDFDLLQDPPKFINFGQVELIFQNVESYSHVQSLKYTIDGPGLDHRGGHIWFSERDGDLVGFEIEKPDEPGYESGKLTLVDVQQLSIQEWTNFQQNALSG